MRDQRPEHLLPFPGTARSKVSIRAQRRQGRIRIAAAFALAAVLTVVATVTLVVTASGATGHGNGPTPIARPVSTPAASCHWRRNGWFC